jgi:hypothetical protein
MMEWRHRDQSRHANGAAMTDFDHLWEWTESNHWTDIKKVDIGWTHVPSHDFGK